MLLSVIIPPYGLFRYLIPWGWRAANVVFQPRRCTVPASRDLDFLQTARTIIGFLIVAGATLHFDEDGVDTVSDQMGVKAGLTMIVGLGVLILGIAGFAIRTKDPKLRKDLLLRALRYPLVTIVYAAGTVWSLFQSDELIPVTQYFPETNLLTESALIFGQSIIGGCAIGFWLRALFLIGKNVFNAANVHPLLPCVLTPIIVCVVAIAEVLRGSSIPTKIQLVLTLSGVITVTVLAAAEWHHYRRKGITIQDGPCPPRPEPTDPA